MSVASTQKNIGGHNGVLIKPRITEKSSVKAEENVFVFEVADFANKSQIASAIKEVYKVTPVRVNVAKIPSERVFVRGRKGVRTGGKKAFVYLKKGDKIDLM
ncbi:50S ribosomal protein L23 [Patescibacteria group bacterium]